MFWLLLLLSAELDLSGTWKVREPVVFESTYQVCHFQNVVAYVTHVGGELTGSYEALISCSDPHWLVDEWRKRIGTLRGTIVDDTVTLTIDDLAGELRGSFDGISISGTVEIQGAGARNTWSARRVRH